MLSLPPSEYYQYFSHIFHGEKLIPFTSFSPDPTWDYPETDKIRYTRIFVNEYSQRYLKDANVLDLGCHIGYFSYISKYLGAKSVTGVNVRVAPIDVANYVFNQLEQDNYTFNVGDIEDTAYLNKICAGKDTLVLTLVLEHLRNPYVFLETISNSDVKNLIFESSVFSDSGPAGLQYYKQTTQTPYTVFDGDKSVGIGCAPNTAWIEMILYEFGWKIERYEVYYDFNKNWFGTPNLEYSPMLAKVVCMNATKFI